MVCFDLLSLRISLFDYMDLFKNLVLFFKFNFCSESFVVLVYARTLLT